jgi:hypothetical protein
MRGMAGRSRLRLSSLALVATLTLVPAAEGRLDAPAAEPTVAIVQPARCRCGVIEDQHPTLKIIVRVTGFRLSAANFGKAPKAGEGHLLFRMDGGRYDHPRFVGANGRLIAQAGTEGRYTPSVKTWVRYSGLSPGNHTVVVFLAGNNHKRLGPSARITFPVEG